MVKKIYIVDKLKIFNFLTIFKNDSESFFIKESFLSKIITFISKQKYIKKLDWKIIDLENNTTKVFTSVTENYEVDNFVYAYLDEFFEKNKLEKNFYHFLVKYLSNNKGLLSFMSIENFIVLYQASEVFFKKKNINLILEKNMFDEFIVQRYTKSNIKFIFYNNYINFNLLKKYLSLFKRFIFIFKKENKFDDKKKICVSDSYQMNKPDSFFLDENFLKKIIFISDNNKTNSKNFLNIYNYVDIKILINLFKNFFNSLSNFKKFNLINYLFIYYNFQKDIYYKFFKKNNIKIFLSSHISEIETSSAIEAINKLNGTSFGFTHSYSPGYSSHKNIDAFNYFFSFNNSKYIPTRLSNLKEIKNFGYITDYKFDKVDKDSLELKEKLRSKGVKYVLGFFDQGAMKDEFFELYSYDISCIGYKFLIKKILENDKYGLIIKPKKPKLLKEKLGETYLMLQKAKETNRCIVLENFDKNHVKNFDDIPAKIAKASDLTIHDNVLAGTAALESALVGSKSVMFDYYKSKKNQFESDGLNIVFRDWNLLWEEIEKDYKNISNSNLGDWNKIIHKFDKFRDGRSNVRITNFIKEISNRELLTI